MQQRGRGTECSQWVNEWAGVEVEKPDTDRKDSHMMCHISLRVWYAGHALKGEVMTGVVIPGCPNRGQSGDHVIKG